MPSHHNLDGPMLYKALLIAKSDPRLTPTQRHHALVLAIWLKAQTEQQPVQFEIHARRK